MITALLWILLPAPVVNSYWHDTDYNGIPEFYSDPASPWETEDADSDGLTNGEESTFGSSPFLPDSDYDSLSDVQEYTISQTLGSNLNPWDSDTDDDGISDYWDSNPLVPLDTDGDGIPDYYDSYPNDPTNDTSYWSGGQFWIDAIFATIGTTAYSTSAGPQDSDSDGIIDAADPYDYDPFNNTAWWNGGSFRISGVEQIFGYMPYTISSGTYDSDNDGIPDGLDPFVSDSSNNTIWWWGGNFLLNGDSQHYFNAAFTAPGDADNDGIPDGVDPYPNDSNNNSIWYENISYWSDGFYWSGASGWYSASSGNVDGDSLPDVLDPYPNDPTNNTSWWYGGTYWINGALTTINLTDPFAWATSYGMYDADGDGIHDTVDPYLGNAANNTAFWQGGAFRIDGYQQGFSADVYGYNASNGMQDSDFDGIPDNADPYVNDSSNNTGFWGGGTFLIAGQWVELPEAYYNFSMSSMIWDDQDMDGIPNTVDPYVYDSSNYTFGFGGGSYVINGEMTELAAGYTAGVYADSDGDGIPDYFDPLPWDSTNNSSSWGGGSWWVDGLSQYFSSAYYATSTYADFDGDGLPDFWDPYVSDFSNNTSWWSGAFFSDGIESTHYETPYASTSGMGDADSDGIPDGVDPYPYDSSNNTAYWSGGTWWIGGLERTWSTPSPYAANLDASDTDGDGIPNLFDPYYDDPTNYTVSFGGGSYVINGAMTELAAGHVAGVYSDNDGDGIPDYFDPLAGDGTNNSSYWSGGLWLVDGNNQDFSGRYYATSAYGDVDNDGLLDLWDPYLTDSSNNTSWWSGSFYSDGLEYTYLQNPYATTGGTGDSDGDGIPNGVDPHPYDNNNNTAYWGGGTWMINGSDYTWATTTPYAANADAGDTDGDGIPNVLDPYPNDSNNNNANFAGGAFRINGILSEFSQYYYSADIGDADGDGIPDFLDPYIDDVTNNTSVWNGDYFYIGGAHTFISGYRATTGDFDADDDGIPDAHDPYPNDQTNNTSYWNGGQWVIGGLPKNYQSLYYATSNHRDLDGDGLLDYWDPYVTDSSNNSAWWDGPIATRINGVMQTIGGGHYNVSVGDTDGDGIPNTLDPYPNDSTNNTGWWAGGVRKFNGIDQSIEGDVYYRLDDGDVDGDGIPNELDLLPLDPTNGTSWWFGDSYWVDGVLTPIDMFGYDPLQGYEDVDEDGIPDDVDPYVQDSTNNTSYWHGGDFWINALPVTYVAQFYATDGTWEDSDLDLLPDHLDPYPFDPENNTRWWSGAYYVDGEYTFFDVAFLPGTTIADADEDGIPDQFDTHMEDETNNTSWWQGGVYVIDGQQMWVNNRSYSTAAGLVDRDGDLLPDLVDPYPRDAGNNFEAWRVWVLTTNPFDGIGPGEELVTAEDWMDAWFDQNDEDRNVQPLYLSSTSLDDTDSDGIPDIMEEYFGLDPDNPADAEEDHSDVGWTHLEQYLAGQNLNDFYDVRQQWVADGIDNMYKVRYEFGLLDPTVAESDPDGDGLITVIEYHLGTNPRVAEVDSDDDGAPDAVEDVLGTNPTDGGSSPELSTTRLQELANTFDVDGDGYSGSVERQYNSDPTNASDTPEKHPSYRQSFEYAPGYAYDRAESSRYLLTNSTQEWSWESRHYWNEGLQGKETTQSGPSPQLASLRMPPASEDLPRAQWSDSPVFYIGSSVAGALDEEDLKVNRWEMMSYKMRLKTSIPKVVPVVRQFLAITTTIDARMVGTAGSAPMPFASEQLTNIEMVTLTIAPNELTSNEFTPEVTVTQGKSTRVTLSPVGMAVDSNRDGNIQFDNELTSQARPFRFWVNTDKDPVSNSEFEDEPISVWSETDGGAYATQIEGIRDLEDFTRLHLDLQCILQWLKSGDVELGFKFVEVTDSPYIRLYNVPRSQDGSTVQDGELYLTDIERAVEQCSGMSRHMVASAGKFLISYMPKKFWQSWSSGLRIPFIWEGSGKGSGKLRMVLRLKSGKEVEVGGVWLKLMNVHEMYERARITVEAEDIVNPWDNDTPPALGWSWDPNGRPYVEDPEAEKKTIVFVHGWRMTYNECDSWGQTTFKRLWQMGYKGRFYTFRWPTYSGDNDGLPDVYVPGGLTYNPTEYRAWLSGPALASFVNQLPNSNARYLFAHSMGNVISGVAIRNGMKVSRYALCNSAMAAQAYGDETVDFDQTTPDTDSDETTRAKFGLTDKFFEATPKINFYLGADSALNVWETNNAMFKPQKGMIFDYSYRPQNPVGEKLIYGMTGDLFTRSITQLPEAMGYVTKSRSKAAGSRACTANSCIADAVDMSEEFGFGDEHSAQWVYSIQKNDGFWKTLLRKFSIKTKKF